MGDVLSSDIQSEKIWYIPWEEPERKPWTVAVVVLSVLCNETKTWNRQKVDETKTTVFESWKMTFTAELQSDAYRKLKKNWLICC